MVVVANNRCVFISSLNAHGDAVEDDDYLLDGRVHVLILREAPEQYRPMGFLNRISPLGESPRPISKALASLSVSHSGLLLIRYSEAAYANGLIILRMSLRSSLYVCMPLKSLLPVLL